MYNLAPNDGYIGSDKDSFQILASYILFYLYPSERQK